MPLVYSASARLARLVPLLLAACLVALASPAAEAKPKPKTQAAQLLPIEVINVEIDDEGNVVAEIKIGNITAFIPLNDIQILPAPNGGSCPILSLTLEIEELNLLGLVVELDNCAEEALTVEITGETGPGKLLGNLLCGLLGNVTLPDVGGIDLGDIIGDLTPEQIELLEDIIQLVLERLFEQATSLTTLATADAQVNNGCTILDLALGEIHLDLLGLNVDTSEICLSISGQQGLLGNLLCNIANLLNNPNASLNAILNRLDRLAGILQGLLGV
jgi:hypothetical protein